MQIRAARALLGWDQARLAKEADVSVITIKRLETAEEELPGRFETVMKVKRAVEGAGIEFLGGGDRIGVVRLAKRRTVETAPAHSRGMEVVMTVQGLNNVKHHVRDWEKSVDFYRDTLGLKPLLVVPGQWAEFALPDGGKIGLVAAHDDVTHPPHVMLRVSDLTAMLAAMKTGGATIISGLQQNRYGKTALIKDPSGNVIELIEPPAQ